MATSKPGVHGDVEVHAISQPEKRVEHAGTLTHRQLQKRSRLTRIFKTFRELYDWSVGSHRTDFWEDIWNASGLIYEGSYSKVVDTSIPMDSIPQWFEGTQLNFAENILYSASPANPSKRTTQHKEDAKIALTEVREGNAEVRHLSWGKLRRKVALLANALRAKGIKKGARVAVVASTSFDTFITFMAIVSVGGLFSSSSTDMGTKGILESTLR